MGFFRWLYRLPGRIDRRMEKVGLVWSSSRPGSTVADRVSVGSSGEGGHDGDPADADD
jgi:hypothetical protein